LTFTLTKESKEFLLEFARESITLKFDGKEFPPQDTDDPGLTDTRGAFVTIKKQGSLRGCIGRMETSEPLWRTVASMARASAFEDPRFPVLAREELDGVSIEISVLTPFEPLTGVDALVIGQHGLLIEKGMHRGVLLPQVPVEQGWDAAQFLEHICLKAGLPTDAWKHPDTKLFVFSALIISE
jgi:AmmeMemoRadiSam system protein A